MHVGRSVGCAALLYALGGLPACAVHAYAPAVDGYPAAYAETVPVDIYAYPHVWYDGSYAYLVGNSWYYPSGGGWVVLRNEPPQLYQYRSYYYGHGGYYGPGYYRGGPRYTAPPAYGYPPPAQRVR